MINIVLILISTASISFLGKGVNPLSNPQSITGYLSIFFLLMLGSEILAFCSGLLVWEKNKKLFRKMLSIKRLKSPPTGFKNTLWSIFILSVISLSSAIATSYFAIGPMPTTEGTSYNVAGGSIIIAIILKAIITPFLEETVFRFLFLYSSASIFGYKTAIPLTIVIFALLHYPTPSHTLATVPGSIIFTLSATRTGSLLPSISIHMLHNLGALTIPIFLM